MKTLEQYEEERVNRVKEYANELFKNGMSPFIRENFEEFMREYVEDEDRVTGMYDYLSEYTTEPEASVLLSIGITFMRQMIDYWQAHSLLSAERETPSAIDVMGDEKGRGDKACNGK